MRQIDRVSHWNSDEVRTIKYDHLIASMGYEQRARHIAEFLTPNADRRSAIGFDQQKAGAFSQNRSWFRQNGFETDEVPDSQFYAKCKAILKEIKADAGETIRLCVDISSMSRFRIANVFAAISELNNPLVSADFVYSIAKYVPPNVEMIEIERAGPVVPQLAGWSKEPERPSTVIFGLGYERDKAIGALEYVEPAEVWAFQAISPDHRYDRDAQRANFLLWQVLPEHRRITYRVDRPLDCFIDLESLTHGVLQHSRPILIPFGPKMFALCCVLVGNIHYPRVGVWRVTSGENEPVIDRVAEGTVVGLRVQFCS